MKYMYRHAILTFSLSRVRRIHWTRQHFSKKQNVLKDFEYFLQYWAALLQLYGLVFL